MPPTTTTKSAPRKYGGKSKWDLRALGVSTKASKKSKASATNAKSGATKTAVAKTGAAKPAIAMPGATKASDSTKASRSVDTNDEMTNTKDETMNLNINNETVNKNMSNEGGKVQDKEVMEMFRKFQEAQAAEAQAASDGFGSSGATTVLGITEPSTALHDTPSFDFGVSDSSTIFDNPDSINIFDDKPYNIFGLRESPDIFDDKPSFNFATTASGELVLLNSQGIEVSVLATYAIPDKDRLPTFEGEVDFFRDWTREQLDEEQHAPINDRKAARMRLRRKRFDFVGEPGYRVYLARRERRLTEDEDDFLPRKRMHTTQDLANMRAKWKVRRERPLRERALRRCLRQRAVKYGKGVDVDKARKGEYVDKRREVIVEREVVKREKDGLGDEGCQVDEVHAMGGDEQAIGEEDHRMDNVEEGEGEDEDDPMGGVDEEENDGEDEQDDDDDADAPRVPFRRESTPEPEGEEDWIM
ncbi:hypothetical protein K523DRAFT_412530 [Schizophyllum commune Tattone D]|nr:hypothetical protein K523DRAFT_412530 [Schizophyllum commune Tattone D]